VAKCLEKKVRHVACKCAFIIRLALLQEAAILRGVSMTACSLGNALRCGASLGSLGAWRIVRRRLIVRVWHRKTIVIILTGQQALAFLVMAAGAERASLCSLDAILHPPSVARLTRHEYRRGILFWVALADAGGGRKEKK
jgi:hypothetical protein